MTLIDRLDKLMIEYKLEMSREIDILKLIQNKFQSDSKLKIMQ